MLVGARHALLGCQAELNCGEAQSLYTPTRRIDDWYIILDLETTRHVAILFERLLKNQGVSGCYIESEMTQMGFRLVSGH